MNYPKEKRSIPRDKAKDCYRAEIRLAGVPVHEVKLIDLSSIGGCILVKEDSILLSNLTEEQTLQVKYYLDDRTKPSYAFAAQIRHITKVKEGRFKGQYSVGLSILNDKRINYQNTG